MSCFCRAGLHPLDLEVGKWLRKHAPQIKPVIVMNKAESIGSSLDEVASEALALGFGEPIAISAETGLGMTTLYEVLRPLVEDYMVETLNGNKTHLNLYQDNHTRSCFLDFLSLLNLTVLY